MSGSGGKVLERGEVLVKTKWQPYVVWERYGDGWKRCFVNNKVDGKKGTRHSMAWLKKKRKNGEVR
jgi:hypothetical protein